MRVIDSAAVPVGNVYDTRVPESIFALSSTGKKPPFPVVAQIRSP